MEGREGGRKGEGKGSEGREQIKEGSGDSNIVEREKRRKGRGVNKRVKDRGQK